MKRSTVFIAVVSVILLVVILVCYGLKRNSINVQNQENWKFGDWNEPKSVSVDKVKPIAPVKPTTPEKPLVEPTEPKSQILASSYEEALSLSKEKHKRVLVFFHASWCSPCKQMEEKVFTESNVKDAMLSFVFLTLDVDKEKELCQKYNINSIPSFVIIDEEEEICDKSSGYKDAKTYTKWLEKFSS